MSETQKVTDDEVAQLPYGAVLAGFEGRAIAVKASGLGHRKFQVFYPDEEQTHWLTINYTQGKLTRLA